MTANMLEIETLLPQSMVTFDDSRSLLSTNRWQVVCSLFFYLFAYFGWVVEVTIHGRVEFISRLYLALSMQASSASLVVTTYNCAGVQFGVAAWLSGSTKMS
jgi:hypothetical protein